VKQRSKNFGMVEHDPRGIFPIRIATIHTQKGAGFWAMGIKKAKRLRAELDKAIKRAAAPRGGEAGKP
jgi:hypothetical protein